MSKARPRAKQRKKDIVLPLLPGQKRDPKLGPRSPLLAAQDAIRGFKLLQEKGLLRRKRRVKDGT